MLKLKKLFKKSPIVVVIVGVLIASVASAALVVSYVTITGTATVEQAVITTLESEVFTETAGNTYIQDADLENRAEVIAPIEFVTTYFPDGGGIDTSFWSTLVLENKNDEWAVIVDDTKATLTYELVSLVSSDFNYEFEATGLIATTEYSLIYYADRPERFEDWGGDNPGALIDTFTTNASGDIVTTTGSVALGVTLPNGLDWNATAEADYCVSDLYDLCRGAKIWLVPSSDYSEPELTLWNPSTYLFETDLITYGNDGTLNLYKGVLNFFVKNVFDVGMEAGAYTINTDVVPIQ